MPDDRKTEILSDSLLLKVRETANPELDSDCALALDGDEDAKQRVADSLNESGTYPRTVIV